MSGGRAQVLIVGGGFGGLEAAKALKRAEVDVTLVDRANHHLFQPLLYQVAMAGLSPAEIAIPIRSVLSRQKNVRVLLAEVRAVELGNKRVLLEDGSTLGFDYLILATGARTHYFGHDDWAQVAPGLKSVEDAIEIRRRVLLAFERAERSADPELRRRLLSFVVIGGGPTGVELAGALSELARRVLDKDFRAINPKDTRVILIEGGPRLLPSFHESLSASTKAQLEKLGVEVRTGVLVKSIDAEGVSYGDPVQHIPAATVIWAAGVAANRIGESLGVELDRGGRVKVLPDCSVPAHPHAFVIGDQAFLLHEDKPLPGVSPVAMQQGRHVAHLIRRALAGQPSQPFHYLDKGSMATIGRSKAVASFAGLRMSGFLAWLIWLFVHIVYLVGFKNRFFVFLQWIFSYLAYRRGARLITGGEHSQR